MLVLIADDDATARQVLSHHVQQLGHETIAARDGTEAWDRFRQSHPEVVITDWTMPNLSGIELCKLIRGKQDAEYTYVTVVTALREHRYALQAMRAGVDDYLTKPVDPKDLELRLLAAERLKASYASRRVAPERGHPHILQAGPSGDEVPPVPASASGPRRVLIADDDPVARSTYGTLVDSDGSLELVGAVENAEQAVALARTQLPDVALLDWIMPGGGVRAATQIHRHSPTTAIIGMSASDEPAASFDMLRVGARDFMQKGTPTQEVLRVLHTVGR